MTYNTRNAMAPQSPEPTKSSPRIGDTMPDGTVYAGISPSTGGSIYTTPADASLTCTFNEATIYAKNLNAHDHADWRIPTKAELNALFNHRAAIGGFNTTGPGTAAWYWSSSPGNAWEAQRFTDGRQDDPSMEDGRASLRCVR
jgi:hypothetical protein